MSSAPSGRWRRFSLRTLFLLVSVCCFFLGGWTVYVNPFRLQAQSLAVAIRLQGDVVVLPAPGPPWWRWIVTKMLGTDAFIQVVKLDLSNRPVDDAALRSLGGLAYLQKLDLDRTQITDASIPALVSMQDLMSLSVRYTNLSDRSAPSLAALTNLRTLYLTGTQLTDIAVDDLSQLQALSELYVRWTQISNAAAERLAKLLPRCAIYHSALSVEKATPLAD
jgi:Leucine Rich Repeat (LRR) protein